MFFSAKSYVDARVNQLQPRLERQRLLGEQEDDNIFKGEFLTYLLASKTLTMKQIYANITEVMLGGIDTVCMLISYLDFDT